MPNICIIEGCTTEVSIVVHTSICHAHWSALPADLRKRWWRETGFGRRDPTNELLSRINKTLQVSPPSSHTSNPSEDSEPNDSSNPKKISEPQSASNPSSVSEPASSSNPKKASEEPIDYSKIGHEIPVVNIRDPQFPNYADPNVYKNQPNYVEPDVFPSASIQVEPPPKPRLRVRKPDVSQDPKPAEEPLR